MKPIYFPYTCLPAKAMESLAIFFRQVIAYQPSDLPLPAESDALVQAGRLNFRVPVAAASDNQGVSDLGPPTPGRRIQLF